jgi:hypothetical protein
MKTRLLLGLLLVKISFAPSVAESAPPELTNHTYQLVSGSFTWRQANEDAERRGGHLATFTSQAEYNYVRSLGLPLPTAYWIGATDEQSEGTWRWVTGEPWGYSSWASGEPNNQGDEDYLAASGSTHFWNDWGTGSLSAYLLETDNYPCTPRKAQATAELVNGFVVEAVITDVGCGYTNPPVVLIQGGGGIGALAKAVVTDGKVTAIQINDAGCCYNSVPRIVVASPPLEATTFQVENVRWTYVFYENGLSINVLYPLDEPKKRAVGFKLSEGMEVPAELGSFKFARQKSKLAGTIRGSYFVIKGEY